MSLRQRYQLQHAQRQQQLLWRQEVAFCQQAGQKLRTTGGDELLNFAGNDYLGLAHDQRVIAALNEAARQFGVGSGASRLVSGTHPQHIALEDTLAEWLQQPAALYFASGFQLNMGIVQSLLRRGDEVISDRLNHASLIDSARFSEVRARRYRHLDMNSLRQQLQVSATEADAARLILSDGVFSMDGDEAPLGAMQNIAAEFNALLVIDDAHGIGVLGGAGRGSFADQEQTIADDTLLIGTCGKAIGTSGAFVVGDEIYIEQIRQFCRSRIYSTAPPPALAAATRTAIEIIQAEPERRSQLHSNIQYFKRCLMQAGLPVSASKTAIQPLILGSNKLALSAAKFLLATGFFVAAMREPTVPRGSARLRITLSSEHTSMQIDALVDALQRWWQSLDQDEFIPLTDHAAELKRAPL